MDTASLVRSLREKVGMNRKEFSEYTGIPVRTLEDWGSSEETTARICSKITDVSIEVYAVDKSG